MSKQMHITYLIYDIFKGGGMERVTATIANKLVEMGYKITIISLYGNSSFFFLDSRIDVIYLEKKGSRLSRLCSNRIALGQIFKKIKPDVHINVGTGLSVYTLLNIPTKTMSISWEHFIYEHNLVSLVSRIELVITRKISDKIVVLTPKDVRSWNHKKVFAISNPLSFAIVEMPDYCSKQVISVGRLEREKGFDLLIESWREVMKLHPDAVLNIYGEGSERENLQHTIDEYNLQKIVRLHRPVKNIHVEMLRSSVYVSSSRVEPWGLVLTEAMECGLPVVAFDCPHGPAEIISNGNDGFLVEAESVPKMSAKIIQMLDDSRLCQRVGQTAKQNVKRYEIEPIIREWEKIFCP